MFSEAVNSLNFSHGVSETTHRTRSPRKLREWGRGIVCYQIEAWEAGKLTSPIVCLPGWFVGLHPVIQPEGEIAVLIESSGSGEGNPLEKAW